MFEAYLSFFAVVVVVQKAVSRFCGRAGGVASPGGQAGIAIEGAYESEAGEQDQWHADHVDADVDGVRVVCTVLCWLVMSCQRLGQKGHMVGRTPDATGAVRLEHTQGQARAGGWPLRTEVCSYKGEVFLEVERHGRPSLWSTGSIVCDGLLRRRGGSGAGIRLAAVWRAQKSTYYLESKQ